MLCVCVGWIWKSSGLLKERMDTNDSLRVASLWHSIHAIPQAPL